MFNVYESMARVTPPMGITRISGKMGNMCFRTMKATGRVYMYRLRQQRHQEESAKDVSKAVMAQRARFAAIAKIVRLMRAAGSKKSAKELWKLVSQAL